MAAVSVFAGMTGKNRHFPDLSQQVLSGVVGTVGQFALKARRCAYVSPCVTQRILHHLLLSKAATRLLKNVTS